MSEFKLARTTQEWVLDKEMKVYRDDADERNFIVRGGPNLPIPISDIGLEQKGAISFTHNQFKALIDLWKRELKPSGVQPKIAAMSSCNVTMTVTRGVDTRKHVCHKLNVHRNGHSCPCGFKWS